jgi:hypothetical protein
MENNEKPKLSNNDIIKKLESDLTSIEKIWNTDIENLAKRINNELKDCINLSAEAISIRQRLVDEKTNYYYKIYHNMPALKQLHKEKFEYYSLKYQIKTNGSEKLKLIESDLAYHDAKMDLLQNHINFLSESIKTMDNIIYSIKNKIELYNIIGLD